MTLRVGLTGGIGSGKSTVATQLRAHGAHVVDADRVAREVVAPGEPALDAIREEFGEAVFTAQGDLDRPALGRVVFGDPAALARLEAITHPAIWARTAQLMDRAPKAGVVVHDMPLLVEKGMSADYHLVLAVMAPESTRLDRLVTLRGMAAEDAQSRIRAQASDEQRRAAADVLLENAGSSGALERAVADLWQERIAPFAANLASSTRARRPERVVLTVDPSWPQQAHRLTARIGRALAAYDVRLDHIGSTAVAGLPAKDVIDLQLGVRRLRDADRPDVVTALGEAGYVPVAGVRTDNAKDGTAWEKRFFGGCDPGRIVHLHVREVGSPGWAWALRFRDWLRANPEDRADYARTKSAIAATTDLWDRYPEAKEPWFDGVHERVLRWAERTHWSPDRMPC